MFRRKREISIQLNQFLDILILTACFWFAHQIRWKGTFWFDLPSSIGPFSDFIWILAIIIPSTPLFLELHGFYVGVPKRNFIKTLGIISRSLLWTGVILAACVIFLKFYVPSRAVLILFGIFAAGALVAKDRFIAFRLRKAAQGGRVAERAIVVGDPEATRSLAISIRADPELGIDVIAEIDIEKTGLESLREALHKSAADRVLFAAGKSQLNTVEAGIQICELEGVESSLFADFISTSIARPCFELFGHRPVLTFRCTPDFSWAILCKTLMDRVLAVAALAFFSPLMLVAAIGVRLSSPGPILFSQERSGKHGRPFRMLKFRTMYADAERRLAELEVFNEMSGPVFKLEKDPRVTPFGAWLRRTSIDELPQLFNVLAGQMSLVGPRPLPVYETAKFNDPAHRRRLSVHPGLTCLWQVKGRNKINNFEDWIKLDLEYIDNWSLWLDLKILFQTIPAVLIGFGAK